MNNKQRSELLAKSLGIEPDYNQKPIQYKKIDTWYKSVISVVVFLLIALVLRMTFTIVKVDGNSMQPTLQHNDFMLVKKEKPKRFDIVVLDERLEDGGETKKIVKRVIGLPNDHITVIDGVLYINNSKYEEHYLSEENIRQFKLVNFDTVVPEGHIFVLGDNRDISKDSRSVGNFKESALVGVRIL